MIEILQQTLFTSPVGHGMGRMGYGMEGREGEGWWIPCPS